MVALCQRRDPGQYSFDLLEEGASAAGAADDTCRTSRADKLEQLIREALDDFDAFAEEFERELMAGSAPGAEVAAACDVLVEHPVQNDTIDTSGGDAPARRRNRGRRRKWLAAQAAAVDRLCAD